MRGLPSGSLPIRYNSRENEIKMRRKKTEKKQFYIGDIFRVIGLVIAFSVLLYPTVSNYLYEKNKHWLKDEVYFLIHNEK